MRLSRHTYPNIALPRPLPLRLVAPLAAALATLACSVVASLVVAERADAARRVPRVWSPLQHRYANVIRPRHLGPQLSTWYGPGFYGNRTGCGSTLRARTWGVAHRTLPCGKLVWLRFRGRSIAVPVVDRGPYSGATLDLTERTARYLRFRRHGTGYVRASVMRRRIPISRL